MHDLKDVQGAVAAWEELLQINPLAMAPNGRSVMELVETIKKKGKNKNIDQEIP